MTKSNTTVEDVAKAVCLYYGTTMAELSSLSRRSDVVRARAMYFYACRMQTTESTSRTATLIDRDHSTAVHHFKKYNGWMTKDEQEDYDEIVKIPNEITDNKLLDSFSNLGRYFPILENVEFAVWN